MRVATFDLEDPRFAAALRERGASLGTDAEAELDLAFLMVHERGDLDRLADLRPLIRSNGAIWVLRVKGPAATVREVDVIEAGQRHRLVDNKIASFSDTLAAMRLVIPVALR
jgi:hypothetical protein